MCRSSFALFSPRRFDAAPAVGRRFIRPMVADGQKAYTTRFTNVGLIPEDAAASAVPEPSTWAMMIIGLFDVGFASRRKVAKRLAAFGNPLPP
jgi:PEP-CTERM motif